MILFDKYHLKARHCMKNIQRISLALKIIFIMIFILLPTYNALFWITNGFAVDGISSLNLFLYEGPALPAISSLPLTSKITGCLISFIFIGLYMLILGYLIKLFHLFSKGEILSFNIVIITKRIAWILLITQLARPLFNFLMSLTLTWYFPPGLRFAYLGFNLQDALMISISLVVLLISWVFSEYYKIHQEQEYVV